MTERWNILEEIKDMRAEGPIFSTFTGPEPDVWPVLERSERDILFAIVVIALAFAAGVIVSVLIERNRRKTN